MKPVTLNLIPGGRCTEFWVNQVYLVASPSAHPPFATDAVVLEEDTYLVLSADAVVRHTEEHPIRLMTALFDQQPLELGCVVVRGNRLLAVIHDLDRDPTCCEQWVSQALHVCLKQADQLGLRSLALPLLGSVHGRIPYTRSLILISEAVSALSFQALRRIWLIVPETQQMAMERFLRLRTANRSQ
ncbi:MAG: hypothetical protein HC808_04460 [Candidatus Competibacteraceae bacterium]|nr:hypothetical protein [Candidatus Competibacteraceae bacterium]